MKTGLIKLHKDSSLNFIHYIQDGINRIYSETNKVDVEKYLLGLHFPPNNYLKIELRRPDNGKKFYLEIESDEEQANYKIYENRHIHKDI